MTFRTQKSVREQKDKRVQTVFTKVDELKDGLPPKRAEQQHKNALDIDYILKKYSQVGYQYGNEDRSEFMTDLMEIDFHEYSNYMAEITSEFYTLSAEERGMYNNDVGTYHHALLEERRLEYEESIKVPVDNIADTTNNSEVETEE